MAALRRTGSAGPDYLELARTLREVERSRSARADAGNDAKVAAGGVRLDDLLNHLDSGADDELLAQWRDTVATDLRAGQAQHDARVRQSGAPDFDVFLNEHDLPDDGLRRRLAVFFDRVNGGFSEDVPLELMPRAFVSAFAQAADEGGVVLPEQVGAVLGRDAERLLRGLAQRLHGRDQPNTRGALKLDELDHRVVSQVARSKARVDFAQRMPLIGEVSRAFGSQDAFAGFRIASVQHLFPSALGLYDALVDNGADPTTTGVGGKSYSAQPDVVARLQADGFAVAPGAMPRPWTSATDAEAALYDMAVFELRQLFHGVDPHAETKPRFLLLDEGGALVCALHKEFPEYAHLCVALEQTDRGIQKMEALQREGIALRCPVVNMARSDLKKEIEAILIGESVAYSIDLELRTCDAALSITPKRATIIGYGAVGRATAEALQRRGYEVLVYDKDPAAMARAKDDACVPLPRDEALAQAHLLVSCTGVCTLTPEEYDALPDGAVIANAASGNHELGLHAVAPDFFAGMDPQATTDPAGRVSSTFHGQRIAVGDAAGNESMLNRVIRTRGGKEILALRSGYVVNMRVGLPPEYRQLIVGMLLGGCLQAVNSTDPGLTDLDGRLQRFLHEGLLRHLATLGLSIDPPRFETLAHW